MIPNKDLFYQLSTHNEKIKYIAEMTLKTAAIPKGVNNPHTVSFFPNVNGITHIIKTFFFILLFLNLRQN